MWMGRYRGQDVAVKTVRICAEDNFDKIKKVDYLHPNVLLLITVKQFAREVLVWRSLSHPNVLSFLGVPTIPRFLLCMVSPWMPHGDVVKYVKSHPEANRIVLVGALTSSLIDVPKANHEPHSYVTSQLAWIISMGRILYTVI